MRNLLFTFFVMFLLLNVADAQVPRKVFIEEFTNASCPPCAAQNPAFNALIEANRDKVIALKRQVWFPGYDPMYETNPTEVREMWDRYAGFINPVLGPTNGLAGVPSAIINGVFPTANYGDGGLFNGQYNGAPAGFNQAMIDYTADNTSPLSIAVEFSLTSDFENMNFKVHITNTTNLPWTSANQRLYIALIEKEISWDEPPGSTNEKDFTDVFRKAIPNNDGIALADIPAGETVTYEQNIAFNPNWVFVKTQMAAIAYIQSTADFKVEQSGESPIFQFPSNYLLTDLTLNNLTVGFNEVCLTETDSIKPVVEINNLGPTAIQSVELNVFINNQPNIITVNESIPVGSSKLVLLDAFISNTPSTSVSFNINKINDANVIESNGTNNATLVSTFTGLPIENLDKLNETAEDELVIGSAFPINGMKLSGNFPGAVMTAYGDPSAPYGGFAESIASYGTNFYQWNPSTSQGTSDIAFKKVSFENKKNVKLFWDRSYSGYTGSEGTFYDGMEVLYSLDCGTTWKSIWQKSGTTLTTAAPQTAVFVPSLASQWVRDSVSLPELENKIDVIFNFRMISNWGNYLWLDNITTESTGSVSVPQLTTLDRVSTYPNPVKEQIFIDFNVVSNDNITVQILNLNGTIVDQPVLNKSFSPGKYQVSWVTGETAPGIYLVKIKGQEGEINKQIVVVK